MTESAEATVPASPLFTDGTSVEHTETGALEPGPSGTPVGRDDPVDDEPVDAVEPTAAESPSVLPDDREDGFPARAAAELARIAELQTRTLDELNRLGEAFSLKIKFDEAKERAIDTLSEEVQRHRQGLHFSILRPLFLDLITLYDDLLQCAGAATGDASTARTFQSLADTVEEILARNGVNAFTVEGETFDGKRQRAVRTIPTADSAQAGQVAQRLRRGFEHDERILRPEHVTTYHFEARQDSAPAPVVPDPSTPQPSAAARDLS